MSEKEQYLKHLLRSKLPKSTEIELHLFEYCNLSCSFCGQDHDSREGMDTIVNKAKQVINFIEKSDLKHHIINVMGGEIFNDDITDDIFKDYYDFYSLIKEYCDLKKEEVRFNFVTNLIFVKNRERVANLLMECENSYLSTSYDFAGRGLDLNRLFILKENLNLFRSSIGVIGFVLTRPSIRKLLADNDKYFKTFLYPNFKLYFDWYVPESLSDKMLPSEKELLEALLFIASNYPDISPVKDIIENNENEMTCYSLNKTTILPNGSEVVCRYLDYEEGDFITPVDKSTNADIIEAHLERNDCLSCEYFNRCQFRCFVQADWRALERLDVCLFKTFFNKTIGD